MVDVDTLKIVLRSLIVSYPGGMTVGALCSDYKASEGQELPYRQLGFTSVIEFLQSLRDTVQVS